MGKRKKDNPDVTKPSPMHNHINLLYQQARLFSNHSEQTLPLALCRNATIQMVTLCEKSHTRLAPILRRSFCSRCYATIDTVNGRSLRFRRKRMLVTCSHCSEKSLLPIVHGDWKPSYPEAICTVDDTKTPDVSNSPTDSTFLTQ
ncbi:ribonuclease P protein subunit RPR2 [Clonorchis sinensis]|uniref:Ribonuclease P protein subunit RPR2 n=1 Tax=Clonorchis sinensis TaxID=79923 RepID=G7Y4L9_CLOSI|nr:ribonuclease P protein subunit RPR2 [Clonorchis sinensis]